MFSIQFVLILSCLGAISVTCKPLFFNQLCRPNTKCFGLDFLEPLGNLLPSKNITFNFGLLFNHKPGLSPSSPEQSTTTSTTAPVTTASMTTASMTSTQGSSTTPGITPTPTSIITTTP